MRYARIATIVSALAVVMAQGIGLTAEAHSPRDPSAVGDIAKLAAGAQAVVHGKVKKVSYRLSSSGDNGGQGVPFTFVTYGITSVLRGATDTEMTLRFIGGPDGQGGFMVAEGVPIVQVGDEDILFVAGNGEAGCPLVMCEFGRFRVFKGAVYEGHGAPVTGATKARISSGGNGPDELNVVRYPAPSFDEILKNPHAVARIKALGLTIPQARVAYETKGAGKGLIEMRTVSGGSDAKVKPASGISLASFLAAVKSGLDAAPRKDSAPIADADEGQAIAQPSASVAAPPSN